MKRRDFLGVLSGAAIGWPIEALAQRRVPRIGVLTLLSSRDSDGRIAALVSGMRDLGYVAVRTLFLTTVMPKVTTSGLSHSHLTCLSSRQT
jgi:hypothetical protein